jgi:hypothetical protein
MRPLPDLRQVRHHPRLAPRLRARLEVEQQLVQDADERGWTREVERHTAVARRLQGLLTNLGEPTDPDTPEIGARPLRICRLGEPIDDFDGLNPLNEWLRP